MSKPSYIGAADWRGGDGNGNGRGSGPIVPDRTWCDRVASWVTSTTPVYSGAAAQGTARARCGTPRYATGPQSTNIRLVTATPQAVTPVIVVGPP